MNDIKTYRAFVKEVFDRYSPIEAVSFSELLDIIEIKKLRKGELLLDVGKISRDIYILYRGIVVAYFLCEDGNEYHKIFF